MMSRISFFILLMVVAFPLVWAKDITLATNQSEYFFAVGENAVVIVKAENSYGKPMDGVFTYTLVQQITQQGFSYSSSNTQSASFTIADGDSGIPISFGSANQPLTLTVNLRFEYDDSASRFVELSGLVIHFVSDNSQNQNGGEGKEASSKKAAEPPKQGGQNQQQQSRQDALRQALQNSQLAQDTNALKRQLDEESQKKRAVEEAFRQNIAAREEFQEAHQRLSQMGYNQTSADLSPESEATGEFVVNYGNQAGQQGLIRGRLENGTISDLVVHSAEDDLALLEILERDSRYQRYNRSLARDQYQKMNATFLFRDNTTVIMVNYLRANSTAAAASIEAQIENKSVVKVTLLRDKGSWVRWPVILILMGILVLLGLYRLRKRLRQVTPVRSDHSVPLPFDYRAEAEGLIRRAREAFAAGLHRDAYSFSAQALRVFLSHRHGLAAEASSDELIVYLKKVRVAYKEIEKCLDSCSLVEFAGEAADSEGFGRLVGLVESVIADKLSGKVIHQRS